jgi:2'-5' RNA ligase
MGRSPYLVEVRTGGETKDYLKDIIRDIANRFDVHGAVRSRPVPHITLFGPYNTNAGPKARRIVGDVCSDYNVVPYRLKGFDHFDNSVVYVDVVPSPELRQLRRDLSRRLRGISYNDRPWDANKYHSFHVTVAKGDISDQFEEIWEYVTNEYSPDINEYATRITSLRGREMMHEYDLLQDRFLSPDEATSYESWQTTEALLKEEQGPDDHDRCSELSRFQRMRQKVEKWMHS